MTAAADTLADHPCFATMSPEDVRSLDAVCTFLRSSPGERVVDEGAPDRDVYFVLSGRVRAVSHTPRQTLIFTDMEPGSFFGEMAAIDGGPRSVSVFALNVSVLARMPRDVFLDVLFAHPPLGLAILSTFTGRIRGLTRRVSELTTLDVRHRVYAELLRLARPDGTDAARAVVSPPPNQSDFAARIGAQRETVSREFGAMEQAGLLERRRGALVLTDVTHLADLIDRASSR